MSIFVPGLLKDIHKKGGEGTNMLSQVSNPLEVDTSHPGFMLRRDLIRIIGNLAYQNKKNQDVVTSSSFFYSWGLCVQAFPTVCTIAIK